MQRWLKWLQEDCGKHFRIECNFTKNLNENTCKHLKRYFRMRPELDPVHSSMIPDVQINFHGRVCNMHSQNLKPNSMHCEEEPIFHQISMRKKIPQTVNRIYLHCIRQTNFSIKIFIYLIKNTFAWEKKNHIRTTENKDYCVVPSAMRAANAFTLGPLFSVYIILWLYYLRITNNE